MTQLATAPRAAADDRSIRTFQVTVPEEQLADLRRRLAATRWPDQETVNDHAGSFSRGIERAGPILANELRLA